MNVYTVDSLRERTQMVLDRSRCRGLAAVALVFGFLVYATVTVLRALEPEPVPDGPNLMDYPGHLLPAAEAAAGAGLARDDVVIGVRVGGHARAYRLALLCGPRNHVINDRLADARVTVTYCERTGCTRVFAGAGPDPLDVRIGGYQNGLLLLLDGHRYRQDTGDPLGGGNGLPFPLAPIEFVRTTWAEWRAAHPDTDVVTDLSGGAAAGN
jgi:hypothetical protein